MFEPQPTPFDLSWRMLGTNIRVHPTFWLFTAILGWSWFEELGFAYLVLWVLCCFGSILLHEFGHILMARAFGSQGYIVLYSFGGLAVGVEAWKRWQRMLIAFAGPGIQLILFGLVFLTNRLVPPLLNPQAILPVLAALAMLAFINLVWPLVNLLPIWPLDGGRISREFFEIGSKSRGLAYSLLLSGILAGGLALLCFLAGQKRFEITIPYLRGLANTWNAVLFAMLAVYNFQLWAAENERINRSSRSDDRLPWE